MSKSITTAKPGKQSKRFYGHSLSPSEIKQLGNKYNTKWVIFSPCYCTLDSPEDPCPCPDNIYFLFRKDDIIATGKFESKNKNQGLNYFDVKKTSKFVIQSGSKPVVIKSSNSTQNCSFKAVATISTVNNQQPGFSLFSWIGDLVDGIGDVIDDLHGALEGGGAGDVGLDIEVVGILFFLLPIP